ncbi:PIG-L family deacetylase [Oscillatoria sp. CS-180]|uniref:PIG-L deacetylase family protein n=1 Tax=Oscillatoria sp. CS-180 TaxID=3021720 RepID=UPI00232EBC8F|nr:PIG-L family deacetylase [Oscillatoria sp. CS-180]MDB9529386.1 PIG-L family deacetylase [Oscillatoria sp. CS-180]
MDQLYTAAATEIDKLPLYSADQVFSECRCAVVVAPHPDDESLGCGGAIALLRQSDIPVQILVVSDGTGSHPNSRRYPPSQLRHLREQETRLAAKRLGVDAQAITFWRWPDKAVPGLGTQDFIIAVDQGRRYLRRHSPALLFVPWRGDQHCDHRAAWQIIQACLQDWSHPPRQVAYAVWGSRSAGLPLLPPGETGWRLDIRSVEEIKRWAIAAHRSQTTLLIDDDPNGFCLTPDMLANLIQPWETYLDVTDKR